MTEPNESELTPNFLKKKVKECGEEIILLTSGYEEHPLWKNTEDLKEDIEKGLVYYTNFKRELEKLAKLKEEKENTPEYNSHFKKQVRELTVTCVYNYNTVYRVCSIFGIKQAKDLIGTCTEEMIQYLLGQFWDFPYPMTIAEEYAARAKLKYVDQTLPELFECFLESSGYNSETLERVFMSHGSGANDVVKYAIENELMPFQLLKYSDQKLSESAAGAWDKMREYERSMSKEEKLPKKLRHGWK